MAGILQDSIQLIKQGKKYEARGMLEVLLRTNPKDTAHWLWYAETLETDEKRVKVLELCLKANPGNPQVEKALSILKARISEAATPNESKPAFEWDSSSNASFEAQDIENKPAFNWDKQPSQTQSSAILWDDDEPDAGVDAGIDWETIEREQAQSASPPVFLSEGQAAMQADPPSFRFYEVWFTALTTRDVREYQALLFDRDAGQARAYEWLAYIGLLSGLLLPLISLGEIRRLAGLLSDIDPSLLLVLIFTASAIMACILSVLGLIFSGTIQFLLSKFMGGRGTFSKTIYAIGAYLAPLTIVSTIISIIPLVNCLSPLVAIYGMILNVRALKAAHDMNTIRAAMVVLLPVFLLLMVVCLIGAVFLPALTALLENMPLP